jgi:hypothetical protein
MQCIAGGEQDFPRIVRASNDSILMIHRICMGLPLSAFVSCLLNFSSIPI